MLIQNESQVLCDGAKIIKDKIEFQKGNTKNLLFPRVVCLWVVHTFYMYD